MTHPSYSKWTEEIVFGYVRGFVYSSQFDLLLWVFSMLALAVIVHFFLVFCRAFGLSISDASDLGKKAYHNSACCRCSCCCVSFNKGD